MQVYRGNSREYKLDVSVDTDNPDDMRDQLTNLLSAKGWGKRTWADFSADLHTRHGVVRVEADP
jgi:hypothetical protein